MDCNCNRGQYSQGSGLNRPQRPAPPCMGNHCGCRSNNNIPIRPPQRPGQGFSPQRPGREFPTQALGQGFSPQRPEQGFYPQRPGHGFPTQMPMTGMAGSPSFPAGMGYVPMQPWGQTYPISQGFNNGTIFPDLNYPFMVGRCTR